MRVTDLPWSHIDTGPVRAPQTALTYERPCPICAANTKRPLLAFEDFQFFSDSATHPKRCRIQQVQCQHCYSIYMNPVYSATGFDILFAEAGASYGASEGRVEEQVDWLELQGLLKTGRTVIDLGCHHGEFLAALPEDQDRIGIDFSPSSIEQAISLHGNNGIRFLASDLSNTLPTLDNVLITMLHVLEHLPDPLRTLIELREQAKAETRLMIEVPILELGRTNDINGFLSVTHLTHFSRASFKYCLEASGWSIQEWDEQQHYNGCRVLLKPAMDKLSGIRGDANDIREANNYLAHWHNAVNSVIEKLAAVKNSPKVIIWGAGLHTEFLYQLTPLFTNAKDRRFLLIDSDPKKQGKSWRGIPIIKPELLNQAQHGNPPILISTYQGQESVARLAKENIYHKGKVVRLYQTLKAY